MVQSHLPQFRNLGNFFTPRLHLCFSEETLVSMPGVRGIQMIFFNVLFVYVCKICKEKFGGCWWLFSWLGQTVKDNNMHAQFTPTKKT